MPCANTLAELLHGLDADRLDAPFGGWLAGGQRSFANAESLLKELCGWHVSDERFRQAIHAEADSVAAWRADAPAPAGVKTPLVEFQIDATTVIRPAAGAT